MSSIINILDKVPLQKPKLKILPQNTDRHDLNTNSFCKTDREKEQSSSFLLNDIYYTTNSNNQNYHNEKYSSYQKSLLE